uniref:Uncharacterized protein n=1 Tax=Ciona savignyi TaxID=51511 RepID=H2YWE3_CIOSA
MGKRGSINDLRRPLGGINLRGRCRLHGHWVWWYTSGCWNLWWWYTPCQGPILWHKGLTWARRLIHRIVQLVLCELHTRHCSGARH